MILSVHAAKPLPGQQGDGYPRLTVELGAGAHLPALARALFDSKTGQDDVVVRFNGRQASLGRNYGYSPAGTLEILSELYGGDANPSLAEVPSSNALRTSFASRFTQLRRQAIQDLHRDLGEFEGMPVVPNARALVTFDSPRPIDVELALAVKPDSERVRGLQELPVFGLLDLHAGLAGDAGDGARTERSSIRTALALKGHEALTQAFVQLSIRPDDPVLSHQEADLELLQECTAQSNS